MNKRLIGVILFTVIEVITMVLWLKFALEHNVLGVIILTIGLGVEHYVSLNVGHDRSPFGPLS